MKKTIFIMLSVTFLFFLGCSKNPTSPKEPELMIRVKSESDLLHRDAIVHFIALSENLDFITLSENTLQHDKTKAGWYIDVELGYGTTEYKEFNKPAGTYYYLVDADVLTLMGQIEIVKGKQTLKVAYTGGLFASLKLKVEYP